jgi:hypothetical protein
MRASPCRTNFFFALTSAARKPSLARPFSCCFFQFEVVVVVVVVVVPDPECLCIGRRKRIAAACRRPLQLQQPAAKERASSTAAAAPARRAINDTHTTHLDDHRARVECEVHKQHARDAV